MTNKKLTEACARLLNIPLFSDGEFVDGYVWDEENEWLKRHNEGNQDQYFAPLSRIADAISVASFLRMELGFMDDRAYAKCKGITKSFVYASRIVPAYRNDAMCRAICVLAFEIKKQD